MTAQLIWTEEMDATLSDGLQNFRTTYYMADEIGVAEGSIRNRIKALGLKRPIRPMKAKPQTGRKSDMELEFADLLAEGFTAKEAAFRTGYSNGNAVLQRIRAKLGWQAV